MDKKVRTAGEKNIAGGWKERLLGILEKVRRERKSGGSLTPEGGAPMKSCSSARMWASVRKVIFYKGKSQEGRRAEGVGSPGSLHYAARRERKGPSGEGKEGSPAGPIVKVD